jgi:hypothetical protein
VFAIRDLANALRLMATSELIEEEQDAAAAVRTIAEQIKGYVKKIEDRRAELFGLLLPKA